MICQRDLTFSLSMQQLETVHGFSPELHERMCLGLLDAVGASTMKHEGHERAAMRFYAHGDICVALAASAPIALPKQGWWQKTEVYRGPVYLVVLAILFGICIGVRL